MASFSLVCLFWRCYVSWQYQINKPYLQQHTTLRHFYITLPKTRALESWKFKPHTNSQHLDRSLAKSFNTCWFTILEKVNFSFSCWFIYIEHFGFKELLLYGKVQEIEIVASVVKTYSLWYLSYPSRLYCIYAFHSLHLSFEPGLSLAPELNSAENWSITCDPMRPKKEWIGTRVNVTIIWLHYTTVILWHLNSSMIGELILFLVRNIFCHARDVITFQSPLSCINVRYRKSGPVHNIQQTKIT